MESESDDWSKDDGPLIRSASDQGDSEDWGPIDKAETCRGDISDDDWGKNDVEFAVIIEPAVMPEGADVNCASQLDPSLAPSGPIRRRAGRPQE